MIEPPKSKGTVFIVCVGRQGIPYQKDLTCAISHCGWLRVILTRANAIPCLKGSPTILKGLVLSKALRMDDPKSSVREPGGLVS